MVRSHALSTLSFASILATSSVFALSLSDRDTTVGGPAACCKALSSKLSGKCFFPGDSTFQAQLTSYYSAEESELVAACRVTPTSTQEVSTALQILTNGSCPFAVRSGGHMIWAGAANINSTGVTIDLTSLDSISISPDKSSALVQPGLRLAPLYDALEAAGLTMVAGRSQTVAVGGFLLGGGISNLSPQHGFGNDNIINYEVVLSDGSIVQANATSTSHSDLFWALKAGGTNFGIITRYDVKTYPLNPMWGGFRFYNISQEATLLNAMKKFMTKSTKDLKAGISGLNYGFNDGVEYMLVNYAYLSADGSNADVYSDLLAIPFTASTLRTNVDQQNLSAEIDAAFPAGTRAEWATLSFQADTQLVMDISAKAKQLFSPLNGPDLAWSILAQTLATPVQKASAALNNPQNLGTGTKDLFLWSVNTYYKNKADDAAVDKATRALLKFVSDTAQSRGLSNPWIYANYAMPDQDVYGSYGSQTVSKLKSLKAKYDSKNVFGKLWRGGFKL
ncbi:hypothetical protein C8J56DRAFT_1031251 [Mycena floridula]|nr:hypothetical protein C8J56DRAFT_1031251 [Mycena floridula]